METSIKYYEPINKYSRRVNLDEWFVCYDLYKKGDYYPSFIHLLRYINPPYPIPDTPELNLKYPHGSVHVQIQANKDFYKIDVPFLKFTPNSMRVPAMRQMIEANFSSLILGQIELKEDELWIHYEDRMSNFDPYKVYDLLNEICLEADNTDDYYVDRFKLDYLEYPKVEKFTSSEMSEAKKVFKEIIEDGLRYAQYLESNRWYYTTCDMFAITYLKLRYVLFPQGIFGRDINADFLKMYENIPINNLIVATKERLTKLLSYDEKKMEESLFHPNFLMPIKPRAEVPRVQEFLVNAYNNAKEAIYNKNYPVASLGMYYHLYNLMDLYTLPIEFSNAIPKVFQRCSNQDWKYTAEQLFQLISKIMEIRLDTNGNLIEGSMDLGEGNLQDTLKNSSQSIFSKITNFFKK